MKDGSASIVHRYVTVKERLDAAKAAAPFYAPRLASQELNVKGSVDKMSDDELKAELEKAMKFLAPKVVDHGRQRDGEGSATQEAGPDREGAVDQPGEPATDGRAEDQEAQ